MAGVGVAMVVLFAAQVGTGAGQGFLDIINEYLDRAGLGRTTTARPTFPQVEGNSSDLASILAAQGISDGFRDCRRRCDNVPRICYFRLHVERYSVLGGACRNCAFGNSSDCVRPQCVTANGFYRGLISVNRQLSAPPIHVCRRDRVIVDVVNQTPDEVLSIHWHGLRQRESQYYDGVPYVTQCPILPGNIFRYNFTADESGTFFYHSHIGIQKMDGVAGPFIVRDVRDSQSNLYTDDLPEHVLFIGDWSNRPGEQYLPGYNTPTITQVPNAFLVNGRGLHYNNSFNLPLSEFVVTRGRRYRFRLIGGTCMTCGVAIRFQGHRLLAISADGNLKFSPTTVDSVYLNSADRFDVILDANQPIGTYYIFVESLRDFCNGMRQVAILRYTGSNASLSLPPPPSEGLGVQLNVFSSNCNGSNSDEICVSQLQGLTNAPAIGNQFYAYLYVALDFYIYNNDDLFAPGTYQHYDEPVMGRRVKSLINNISFTFPPSPMLSQFNDIPVSSFCAPQCYTSSIQKACSCTNFYNLPYNTIINLIVYDAEVNSVFAHPYHLHGYNFYIIEEGRLPDNPEQWRRFLDQKMNQLNNDMVDLRNKTQRDTISVPPQGYVLTRFISNNPGFWLIHCHFNFHLEAGMSIVLRVGQQSDVPPVPPNFPRCRNFVPPF